MKAREQIDQESAEWDAYVEQHRDEAVTVALLDAVFRGFLKGFTESLQPFVERLDAVERQLAATQKSVVPKTTTTEPQRELGTPREGAILLMAMLEGKGAIFTLNEDGDDFLCDLNPAFTEEPPEWIPRAVLGFRDEIRQLLLERTVAQVH
jgi:hypothetical protein